MASPVSSTPTSKQTSDTTPASQSSTKAGTETKASKQTKDTPKTRSSQVGSSQASLSQASSSQASSSQANPSQANPSQASLSQTDASQTSPSQSNDCPDDMLTSNSVRNHTPNRAPSFQSNTPAVYQNSDRIAIFIDGSNLFYAASHLSIEVDYRRLLTTLVGNRRLLRAYFYTGVDPQNEKQRGFLLWLNRHGHRVVSKELAHLPDGSRKANMHVEMAVDMMRISEYCSTLTLLGGDGNLSYALQVLSQRGISLEVVSLQSMTSDSLIDLADVYTDLADLRDQIKR